MGQKRSISQKKKANKKVEETINRLLDQVRSENQQDPEHQ